MTTNKIKYISYQNGVEVPIWHEYGQAYSYTIIKSIAQQLIVDDVDKENYKFNYNTSKFSVSSNGGISLRTNLSQFLQTMVSFRSKISGVVKLRELLSYSNSTLHVDNETKLLYAHPVGMFRSFNDILWGEDTVKLLLSILNEQLTRWNKCKEKFELPNEALDRFIYLSTGQSKIFPGNKYLLYGMLQDLNRYLTYWGSAKEIYLIPMQMTERIWSGLTLSQNTRNLKQFNIPGLGCIFIPPKKPLGNLMNTFTTKSIEIKFIKSQSK